MFFRVKTMRGNGVVESVGYSASQAAESAILERPSWFGGESKTYQGVNVLTTNAPNVYEFYAWSNASGVTPFQGFCIVEQVG